MDTIAPLGREHLEKVFELEQRIFAGRDPWSMAAFVSELESGHGLWIVSLHEGRVIGYGGGWCVGSQFHLLNLAVDVSERRRGIGGRMLEWLLRESSGRGCSSAVLEVRKDNDAAIRLYEKCGFKPAGIRNGYYANGEDARVYAYSGAYPAG